MSNGLARDRRPAFLKADARAHRPDLPPARSPSIVLSDAVGIYVLECPKRTLARGG
jgi:hypothetical protein